MIGTTTAGQARGGVPGLQRQPSASRTTWLLAPGAILALAFALRVNGLNDHGFWYDEGFSAWTAWKPIPVIIGTYASDVHPPLYYLLLKGWMAFAGDGEFALRYLSVASGMLTVVLVYKLASMLVDRRAAAAAASLAATSSLLVSYAQEARMYAPAGCLVALAACLLLLALRRSRWKLWVAFSLVQAAALYTHYFTALVLSALGLFALGSLMRQGPGKARGLFAAWLSAQMGTMLLFAPVALTALDRLGRNRSDWIPNYRPEFLAVDSLRSLSLGTSQEVQGQIGPLVLVAALTVILTSAALFDGRSRRSAFLALLWLGLAIGPVIYTGVERAIYHPRYLVQASPAFCVLLGAGLSRGRGIARPALLAAGLILVLIFSYGLAVSASDPQDDARGVADYIAQAAAENDIVLVDSDQPLRYYAARGSVAYVILPTEWTGDEALRDRLNRETPGRDHVFHVQWRGSSYDAKGVVEFYLRSQSEWQSRQQFTGYRVDEYSLPSAPNFRAPEPYPLAYSFEDIVSLVGGAVGPGLDVMESAERTGVVAGGYLPVILVWQQEAVYARDLSAQLLLVDETGHAISKVDQLLVNSAHMYSSRWRRGDRNTNFYILPVPLGTPPGDYSLRAFVYTDEGSRRLSLVDPEGRPQGTEAEVARISIPTPQSPRRSVLPPEKTLFGFGDLDLVDAIVRNLEVEQGGQVDVTLEWWARVKPVHDYDVKLKLIKDVDDAPVAQSSGKPVYGRYPTSSWDQGERVRESRSLAIPVRVPPGSYRLAVSLVEGSGTESQGYVLGDIVVSGMARNFEVPPIPYPQRASFGGWIELLGFEVDAEALYRDRPLRLTLYWRCLGEMETSYKVFTHLLAPGDVVWGQQDNPPLQGSRPTTGWLPGEVLVDPYEIYLRQGAPSGPYQLEIGVYDPTTMERLPAMDSEGRVVDNRIVLREFDLAH